MIEAKKKRSAGEAAKQDGNKDMVEDEFWREPLDDKVVEKTEGQICIIESRCKGCGFCIEFCPKQVLIQSEGINDKGYHPPEIKRPDECVYCQLCELVCPDVAIYVVVEEKEEPEDKKEKEENSESPEKKDD